MKNFILFFLIALPVLLFAQGTTVDLLGKCTLSALEQEPYASWYVQNLKDYNSNAEVVQRLRKLDLKDIKLTIVFGSWCGDSKRELPRMLKLLKQISFSEKNIALIGVDDSTEVYKQSPQHEEAGLGIYRVPTFIVYNKDREIGRIVEFPAESLERDLSQILSQKKYTHNYFSYPFVQQWLKDGLLTDENVSPRGLAMQVYGRVQYESELNACGYVLMAQGQLKEAIKIFRINANLFPQSSNCFDSLGEAYAKAGLTDRAIQSYEMAVKLDAQNTHSADELKKLRK